MDNNGKKVPVDIKDNKDGTYTVIYYPTTVGSYTVNITFNSESIPKSPFKVNVCLTNTAACRAYGPGLEKVRTREIRARCVGNSWVSRFRVKLIFAWKVFRSSKTGAFEVWLFVTIFRAFSKHTCHKCNDSIGVYSTSARLSPC